MFLVLVPVPVPITAPVPVLGRGLCPYLCFFFSVFVSPIFERKEGDERWKIHLKGTGCALSLVGETQLTGTGVCVSICVVDVLACEGCTRERVEREDVYF